MNELDGPPEKPTSASSPDPASNGAVDPAQQPDDLPEDINHTYDPQRTKMVMGPSSSKGKTERAESLKFISSKNRAGLPEYMDVLRAPLSLGDRFTPRDMVNKGGFGEVWSANQLSLDRTVAVKRIRADLRAPAPDSRKQELDILFRREAFTAASLEHPNILPIYDLGVGPDGQPILAMKLVDGDPWDALIERDFTTLSPNAFLARHLPILIATANAVAYAHFKGIIHRDLKPSQVMVGRFGEVLLMDWGLAMRVGEAPVDPSEKFATGHGIATSATATNPAGTPAFMAPEQTTSSTENLGPWTDVYLLGGTLYFLLTGQPPHHGSSRIEAYFRAKNALVTMPEEMAPGREIPKELTRLAMDAMAKAPQDRIQTAEAFLARLQDYLSGESRRRESEELADQVRDTLPKSQGDYALYGESVVKLGNARALWGENPRIPELEQSVFWEFASAALRNRDLTLARVQAERLAESDRRTGMLAEIANTELLLIRQRRERRFALVGVAVMVVLFAVGGFQFAFEQARARATAEAARRDAEVARADAESSRERAEGLTNFMLTELRAQLKPLGRLRLLADIAKNALAYYDTMGAVVLPPESLRKQGLALVNIGDVFRDTGRSAEAIESYTRALDRQQALADARPGDVNAGMEAIRTRNAIARVLRTQGDLPGASAMAEGALASSKRLAEEFPEAEEATREYAASDANVALTQLDQGNMEGATTSIRKSIATLDAAAVKFPESRNFRIDRAAGYSNLGLILLRAGDADGALGAHGEALALREQIDTAEPDNHVNKFNMARTLLALVPLHGRKREIEQAERASARALALMERLDAIDPLNLEWQQGLGAALMTQADLLGRTGNPSGSEASVRRAMEIRELLVRQEGTNTAWLRDLSVSYNRLAELLSAAGKREEALTLYHKDLEIAERLTTLDPTNETWRHDLAVSYQFLGEQLLALNRHAEAEVQLRKGLVVFREVLDRNTKKLAAANDVAWAHTLLGEIRSHGGDAEGAKNEWEDAVAALSPVLPTPEGADAGAMDTYARGLMYLGRIDDARPWVEALLKLDWKEQGLLDLAKKNGLAP